MSIIRLEGQKGDIFIRRDGSQSVLSKYLCFSA